MRLSDWFDVRAVRNGFPTDIRRFLTSLGPSKNPMKMWAVGHVFCVILAPASKKYRYSGVLGVFSSRPSSIFVFRNRTRALLTSQPTLSRKLDRKSDASPKQSAIFGSRNRTRAPRALTHSPCTRGHTTFATLPCGATCLADCHSSARTTHSTQKQHTQKSERPTATTKTWPICVKTRTIN